jgi:thiosulfate/3-mercaptopyruvate sulfurtransferase
MPYRTLISVDELAPHLEDPDWAVVDCRFSFADTEQGRRDYMQAHIPGALYAHLDRDLSGPIMSGQTGRHPLPEPAVLAQTLGGWGIGPGVQVVVYDASGAGNAVRLWWLLRWLGHEAVAVLDGGWPAWLERGRPVRAGQEERPARPFVPVPRWDWVASADEVERLRRQATHLVVDSRSGERYRGEREPIDPVAGHIPGAVCAPYTENLDAHGRFRSAEALRERFSALLKGLPAERAVFYCGSGVTAAHNLFALAHAGLGDGRLYAGSWSEWITDPQRPIALGEEP